MIWDARENENTPVTAEERWRKPEDGHIRLGRSGRKYSPTNARQRSSTRSQSQVVDEKWVDVTESEQELSIEETK